MQVMLAEIKRRSVVIVKDRYREVIRKNKLRSKKQRKIIQNNLRYCRWRRLRKVTSPWFSIDMKTRAWLTQTINPSLLKIVNLNTSSQLNSSGQNMTILIYHHYKAPYSGINNQKIQTTRYHSVNKKVKSRHLTGVKPNKKSITCHFTL